MPWRNVCKGQIALGLLARSRSGAAPPGRGRGARIGRACARPRDVPRGAAGGNRQRSVRARACCRRAAEGARRAPSSNGTPRAADLLLDGLAYPVHGRLRRECPRCPPERTDSRSSTRTTPASKTCAGRDSPAIVAFDLFDDEAVRALATRSVRARRAMGAHSVVLPLALGFLATTHLVEGHFDAAERVLDESDAITEVIGEVRSRIRTMSLAGLRGDEAELSRLGRARRGRGDRTR